MEHKPTLKSSSPNVQITEEKRISIGKRVFIVGSNNFFERKELLCSKKFKKNREQRDEIVHLSYYNNFLLRNKRLSIAARYYYTRAPYGDRIKVKASYDGVCIGDYGLLKATIGVGTFGKWPVIKNNDWQLIITLDLEVNEKGYMHFYVEYFERISPESFCFSDNQLSY